MSSRAFVFALGFARECQGRGAREVSKSSGVTRLLLLPLTRHAHAYLSNDMTVPNPDWSFSTLFNTNPGTVTSPVFDLSTSWLRGGSVQLRVTKVNYGFYLPFT